MYGLKKERNTGRFMKTYPVRVPQTRLGSTELGNAERNAVPYLGIMCTHTYRAYVCTRVHVGLPS